MKTIFISIYDGDTEKNVLRAQTFKHLLASEHRLVLLVGKDKYEYYQREFGSAQVVVEPLMQSATTRVELLWYFIGWNTLPTYSARLRRHMTYAKNRSAIKFAVGTVLGFLGKFRILRELLRLIYAIPPDPYLADLFEKYQPHLVFVPNMFSPGDSRLLRAAKRRGITTVTTAKSWDVLTTKAFTRVKADRLLVYNEFNRQEAIALGDYAPARVRVTGFPQFDVYANPQVFVPREEFLRSIGADPTKRLIMIAVPGDWKTPHTKEIMTELDRRIDAGRFDTPIQVLARFHPKYVDSSESLKLNNFIFDRPGTHLSEKKMFSVDMGIGGTYDWTFTDKDITHLANSLKHSDVLINTESTMTLDAAANDTPTILIGYDGDATLPHWDSVARIYDREHYRHITETNAAPLVKSHDELEAAIKAFLEDPEYMREKRELLKKHMLYKIDGKAGERTAGFILEMLR